MFLISGLYRLGNTYCSAIFLRCQNHLLIHLFFLFLSWTAELIRTSYTQQQQQNQHNLYVMQLLLAQGNSCQLCSQKRIPFVVTFVFWTIVGQRWANYKLSLKFHRFILSFPCSSSCPCYYCYYDYIFAGNKLPQEQHSLVRVLFFVPFVVLYYLNDC